MVDGKITVILSSCIVFILFCIIFLMCKYNHEYCRNKVGEATQIDTNGHERTNRPESTNNQQTIQSRRIQNTMVKSSPTYENKHSLDARLKEEYKEELREHKC
tara:strand:+ start:367 stop:675 length:309 start_codon:yes stop_codon:yes gene_type:complete